LVRAIAKGVALFRTRNDLWLGLENAGLPDEHGRVQIFTIHMKQMRENKMLGDDVDIKELAGVVSPMTTVMPFPPRLNFSGGLQPCQRTSVVRKLPEFAAALPRLQPIAASSKRLPSIFDTRKRMPPHLRLGLGLKARWRCGKNCWIPSKWNGKTSCLRWRK
jgi:hypothetical protein